MDPSLKQVGGIRLTMDRTVFDATSNPSTKQPSPMRHRTLHKISSARARATA